MDDKFSGVRRWRREFLPDMNKRVFLDAGRRDLQRIFSFEETGPRRIQPIFILDMSLLPGVVIRFLADLLVLVFDILEDM